MDNEQIKSNITSPEHWLRLLFMLLFAVILYVAGIVMVFLVAVQFLFALITGRDNTNLRQMGDSLSRFIYDALQFLTYNSQEKPFPFAEWPEGESQAQGERASSSEPQVHESPEGDSEPDNKH